EGRCWRRRLSQPPSDSQPPSTSKLWPLRNPLSLGLATELPAKEEWAGQIDVQYPAPLIEGGFDGGRNQACSRIVHQHVEAAKARDGLLRQLSDILFNRNVIEDLHDICAELPSSSFCLIGRVQIVEHEGISLCRQYFCHSAADAARGTCNHRHLIQLVFIH